MALQLYGHPFSSYTWKSLITLYENGIAFEFRMIDADSPGNGGPLKTLWPVNKFPVLEDSNDVLIEAPIIPVCIERSHDATR